MARCTPTRSVAFRGVIATRSAKRAAILVGSITAIRGRGIDKRPEYEYFVYETLCPLLQLPEPETRTEIDSIVETIIYLYTESRRLTKGLASQFGLTGPQLTVIKLLETFENLSLVALRADPRQNSTVTGIIDRMEREGLVRRERSTTDRRVVHISLSEKGQKLAKQIQVEPMEIFRGALQSLTHADLRDLLRIMNKLQRHVRTHIADAAMDALPSEET